MREQLLLQSIQRMRIAAHRRFGRARLAGYSASPLCANKDMAMSDETRCKCPNVPAPVPRPTQRCGASHVRAQTKPRPGDGTFPNALPRIGPMTNAFAAKGVSLSRASCHDEGCISPRFASCSTAVVVSVHPPELESAVCTTHTSLTDIPELVFIY